MKINIELNIVGDGRRYLNFWNYIDGDDVIAEIKDGKLYQDDKEVSFSEFTEQVEDRINKGDYK